MTLNDFERHNKGFMDFSTVSGCKTFQERIAPK